MGYILQGMAIGIAYIAPIGMQNLFLINTALTQSKIRLCIIAFMTFLFDASLALACFYGMGALIDQYRMVEILILGIGSLLILWIGYTLLRAEPQVAADINMNIPLSKIIMTAFAVTWLNPQALLDGTMLLGAFKASLSVIDGQHFLMGVMLASLIWFTGLSTVTYRMKSKINVKILRIINIICGAIITGYGLRLFYLFTQADFSAVFQ